ncbi:hypothetical protein ACC713_37055, partial [Rhizobium johnstonii]
EVLSDEEANSWTAIFDSKYKGKSVLNTDPLTAFGQAVMAMNTLGLSNVKNPGNPTAAQIEVEDRRYHPERRLRLVRPDLTDDLRLGVE